MKLKPIIHSLLLVALVLLAFPLVHAQQGPGPDFDKYVTDALKEWQVPGVAIAIIKDDRIVLAKGYGTRELDKALPVDERTLFAIGSSSKAFTAASIGMLVDEGRVKWEDPATKYLPGFNYSIHTLRAN
jgi:CubicO group peptidase (beta-lactamase class C family)